MSIPNFVVDGNWNLNNTMKKAKNWTNYYSGEGGLGAVIKNLNLEIIQGPNVKKPTLP